jgi:hypothetical protein
METKEQSRGGASWLCEPPTSSESSLPCSITKSVVAVRNTLKSFASSGENDDEPITPTVGRAVASPHLW